MKEDPAATPADVAASEERLQGALASRRLVSEATRASRLYWWTAEYGLVGSLDAPRIYGAGLLSSIGESTHCFSEEVQRLPLGVDAAEVDFDITRMQPQLFVVPEFGALGEVVDELAATLSWKRGGDHGLRQAQAARTVNHLVLADGTAITGIVSALHPGPGVISEGLTTAAAVLDGPVQRSRRGRALAAPLHHPAVLAFGSGPSAHLDGPFELSFDSGLTLTGRSVAGLAVELRGQIGSRELDLPRTALLLSSPSLPSVAGGPGDPGAWDEAFGVAVGADEGEARARAHRTSALDPRLACLYEEVRSMREGHRLDASRLAAIAAEARAYPDDWLLRSEVGELMAEARTPAPRDVGA